METSRTWHVQQVRLYHAYRLIPAATQFMAAEILIWPRTHAEDLAPRGYYVFANVPY